MTEYICGENCAHNCCYNDEHNWYVDQGDTYCLECNREHPAYAISLGPYPVYVLTTDWTGRERRWGFQTVDKAIRFTEHRTNLARYVSMFVIEQRK